MYRFECAVILPNYLVSSNVLYGTEALYNISENEMREIENIKEVQMRNIFQVNTGIQVPPQPCARGEVLESYHILQCDIIFSGNKTYLENFIIGLK